MTLNVSERARLADLLREAFPIAGVPQSEAELGTGNDAGWPRTVQTFLGRAWDEVPTRHLLWHGGDPFYEFSDLAFAYYLPTYLAAILSDPAKYGALLEHVACQFSPDGHPDARRHASLLTDEQRRAAADVLEAHRDITDDECEWAAMLLRGDW